MATVLIVSDDIMIQSMITHDANITTVHLLQVSKNDTGN